MWPGEKGEKSMLWPRESRCRKATMRHVCAGKVYQAWLILSSTALHSKCSPRSSVELTRFLGFKLLSKVSFFIPIEIENDVNESEMEDIRDVPTKDSITENYIPARLPQPKQTVVA
jgi:hypothetical protein